MLNKWTYLNDITEYASSQSSVRLSVHVCLVSDRTKTEETGFSVCKYANGLLVVVKFIHTVSGFLTISCMHINQKENNSFSLSEHISPLVWNCMHPLQWVTQQQEATALQLLDL